MISWTKWWGSSSRPARGARPRSTFRPALEPLEDRCVPAQISAAFATDFFVIRPDNSVWQNNSFTWFPISGPGFAQSISAVRQTNGVDVVFALTPSNFLYGYVPSTGWTLLGGFFVQISAGVDLNGQANVYALTSANSLYEFNNQFGGFLLGNFVQSFAGVANDSVFAVLTDGSVFEHSAQFGWFRLSSPGFGATVTGVTDARGLNIAFVIAPSQFVFAYDPLVGWSTLGGLFALVTAGRDSSGQANVWAINSGGNSLYEFLNNFGVVHWGDFVHEVSAANANSAFVVLNDGSVFGHNDVAGWFQLSSAGFAHL